MLLRSNNGGKSWVAVSTPTPAITLCAAPSGTLWIGSSSGNIYVSVNSTPWNLTLSGLDVPPPYQNSVGPPPKPPAPWLACAGDTAWAIYEYGAAAGSEPHTIEQTSDSGQQWGVVVMPNGASLVPPNPKVVTGVTTDFGLSSATNSWFLESCGPCTTGLVSVVTTSNGTTFSGTLLSIANNVYASPVDAAFLDPERGWAVLKELPATKAGVRPPETMVVLATSNGGSTWRVVDPDLNAR
jgi:hypothetical protein